MQYLGVSFPDRRAIVRRGFSFYTLPPAEVLAVWDALWRSSPYGDVLFAAIDYYDARVRKRPDGAVWPVVRGWIERVDNWAHADALGGLYSRLLESDLADVYPQLKVWNAAQSEWPRRVSLVSLIHYTGKNAVFLPPEKVLPLVSNCLEDRRHYVQTAVGWVLREMGNVHSGEIRNYIEANIAAISAAALARAIERRPAAERAELRALKKSKA